ncbi:MAG: GspH/FimT family protein [Actinomycetota bacterium]
MNMHSAAQPDAGFSLLELLVVVAVLALLAALVPPYAEAALLRWRGQQAADEIVRGLAGARDDAMKRNQAVPVIFDERERVWGVGEEEDRKLPAGVILAGPRRDRDGRAAIVFRPDGSSTGGQVVVSAGSDAWAVAVDLMSGNVRRRHASGR